MRKYTVQLSSSAEKTYRKICTSARECIAVGDLSNPKVTILGVVDELIDKAIPHNPCEIGRELSHPLTQVFWVSRERLHIFYAVSPKFHTIAILSIWDSPKNEARFRQADVILRQMVLSGQLDHLLVQFGLRPVLTGIRTTMSAVN